MRESEGAAPNGLSSMCLITGPKDDSATQRVRHLPSLLHIRQSLWLTQVSWPIQEIRPAGPDIRYRFRTGPRRPVTVGDGCPELATRAGERRPKCEGAPPSLTESHLAGSPSAFGRG